VGDARRVCERMPETRFTASLISVYPVRGFSRVMSRVFYRPELLFFVRPYEFLTM
jgi:hypothetical protein